MVITIPIGKGLETVIDDIDADLAEFSWRYLYGNSARPEASIVYASRKERGTKRTLLLHRVILARIVGRPLTRAELTDHQDLDGLNNQRYNLRLADHSSNRANTLANRGRTLPKGVFTSGTRYKARMTYRQDGKIINETIGSYETIEEAERAYQEAHAARYGV